DRLNGPRDPEGGGNAAPGSAPGGPDASEPGTSGPDTPQPDLATAEAATPAASPGPRRRVRLGPSPWLAAGFLAPALVLLGAMVVYPIIYSIFRSLYDASGRTFVGADNYVTIFT